ncbi:MAG: type I-E CRISPR-associated protein Cas6/Cse3/CasE [Pyrinomonadaceae bacterium]
MAHDSNEIYLSRLILNPRSREVRRDLGNCHALHCTILKAFPTLNGDDEAKARERFGVLYRLDVDQRKGRATLLAQSLVEPDWSKLPLDYCLESTDEVNPACKSVSESYGHLREGMRLMFRLRANPTRRVSKNNANEKNPRFYGKRVDVRGEEQQLEWLRRKIAVAGCRLMAVRTKPDVSNVLSAPEGYKTGWRRQADNELPCVAASAAEKRRLTFASVLFEGELEVTDAEALRKALVSGIGTGKAYGFGLLSISPIQH